PRSTPQTSGSRRSPQTGPGTDSRCRSPTRRPRIRPWLEPCRRPGSSFAAWSWSRLLEQGSERDDGCGLHWSRSQLVGAARAPLKKSVERPGPRSTDEQKDAGQELGIVGTTLVEYRPPTNEWRRGRLR